MKCTACAWEIPESSRFCPGCGRRLQSEEPHPLVFHGFRLKRKLGQGGMGAVFLAEQLRLGREVALKILPMRHAHRDSSVKRFRREARALARIKHPAIVEVYDLVEEDERIMIAMEYVRGGSVLDLLQARGKVPPREALRIAREAALGLHAAAKEGVVHRDIKPGNLLLTMEGRVRIADFGLVRWQSGSTLTLAGTVLGSVAFMPPEQCADARKADHRSDLYALGCTLFVMLTGRLPFSGKPREVLHKQLMAPAPSLAIFGFPIPLADVVTRTLAKNPDQRYQTGADLAKALAVDPGPEHSAP